MSSLHDLIKKIHIERPKLESYVYYEKGTGKIHKISPSKLLTEDFEVISIPHEELKPLLTGQKRTDEFIIVYDVSLKQIRLKEVAYDDSHNTAATMCYQLPIIIRNDSSMYLNNYEYEIGLSPQYIGIHIDVWYDELSHLAGQHVWINESVYKLLKDQPANTKFTTDNAELFIENVKMYSDENKELKPSNDIVAGDLILKYNNLYLYTVVTNNINLQNDIVIRQDTKHGHWNIIINPQTKKFLRMSGYNPKEVLYFSVTEKYNPNILYRSLEFTIGELLFEESSIIPFIYDAESDLNNVSIYTAKYFDKYVHEII